jgi:hypothetical protein
MKLQLLVFDNTPWPPEYRVIADGPWMIVGYGSTIQQALDDYIEKYQKNYGPMPRYKWK